ncbi:MAG: glycosyltransferase family 39 protein [Chloroflexota bacterium]|nr:glycosyltransferase family 39 protein [Dehalococcoidia bacterium]MDW8255210.1 glycosyltransferase family 39 protein [Chloroflexota bacterium]
MARSWVLVVAVWLAFAIRVFRLEAHPYRGDETFVIWFVQQDWLSLLASIARNEPHPPLFYLIAKGWREAVGDVETVFRFVPLFFGVLAVPAGAQIGARLGGPAVALVAALLLAVNPFYIWNAQDARMYTQALALGLLSLLALLRLDDRPTDLLRLAQYALFSALALLTHYAFLPIAAVQNGFWLLRHRRERLALQRWLMAQSVLAALALSWLFWNRALLLHYVGNGDQPALPAALLRAAIAYLTGRSGSPEWAAVAAIFGAAVAIVGAAWLGRQSGARGWLAAAVVAAGFGAQWAASLRGPVFAETYLLPSSGLYPVLLAAGIVALGQWLLPIAGGAALAVLLVASALALGNYWLDPAYAKAADWRSPARAIARDARPGDVIVLNYPDPTFEYYYRGPIPVRLIPAHAPVDRPLVARQLGELTAAAQRVWLIPVRAPNWDSEGFVEEWLETHALPVATGSWHQVRVVLYETPHAVLAAARRLDIDLGPIRLRGAAIDAPESCSPLCEASIRLVWTATQQVRDNYKVFVHAVTDRGELIAQSDSVPANWRRPTTGWTPGELVVDPHELQLPAGHYRILVGLYRETSGRLRAADGRDAIAIGELTVR